MKVTQAMLDAFSNADFTGCGNADWEDEHVRIGLQAVLDLIEAELPLVQVDGDRVHVLAARTFNSPHLADMLRDRHIGGVDFGWELIAVLNPAEEKA